MTSIATSLFALPSGAGDPAATGTSAAPGFDAILAQVSPAGAQATPAPVLMAAVVVTPPVAVGLSVPPIVLPEPEPTVSNAPVAVEVQSADAMSSPTAEVAEPKLPDLSVKPDVPIKPSALVTPDVSSKPELPTAPQMSEVRAPTAPQASDARLAPIAPPASDARLAPTAPQVSDTRSAPIAPEVSDAELPPEAPQVSDARLAPTVPDISDARLAAKTGQVSQVRLASKAPEDSDVRVLPEARQVSDVQAAPDAPLTPASAPAPLISTARTLRGVPAKPVPAATVAIDAPLDAIRAGAAITPTGDGPAVRSTDSGEPKMADPEKVSDPAALPPIADSAVPVVPMVVQQVVAPPIVASPVAAAAAQGVETKAIGRSTVSRVGAGAIAGAERKAVVDPTSDEPVSDAATQTEPVAAVHHRAANTVAAAMPEPSRTIVMSPDAARPGTDAGVAVTSPAPAAAPMQAPAATATSPVVSTANIGHGTGVAIARHVATGGGETITVRLDPGDMGRIEVRMSFDDAGTLRAVVAADNPASLDLLRRDSSSLTRSLTDAGIATDAQSFHFDARSGGSSGDQPRQRQTDTPYANRRDQSGTADDAINAYQPRSVRGRVDVMA